MQDSPKSYANFDIHIGPPQNGRYPLSVIYSPAGETREAVWQTLPQDEAFTDTIDYLRDLIAQPTDAEALGQRLHDFLFPPPRETKPHVATPPPSCHSHPGGAAYAAQKQNPP